MRKLILIIGLSGLLIGLLIGLTIGKQEQEFISPMPVRAVEVTVVETLPEPTLDSKPNPLIVGRASYYTTTGCIGCGEALTMANGETLDDTKFTIAVTVDDMHQYKLLNDVVTLVNTRTGKSVQVRITDTGGFAKYDRKFDVSKATKNALDMRTDDVLEMYLH